MLGFYASLVKKPKCSMADPAGPATAGGSTPSIRQLLADTSPPISPCTGRISASQLWERWVPPSWEVSLMKVATSNASPIDATF